MTHYTKSQEACYLLRKIERHEDNPGRMPTWVPNWDIPRATVALEPQLASLMSESEFAFPSTGVFEATGVFVAKVKHVEQVGFISEADPGSFLAIIKDLGTRIVPLLKPENTTSLRAVCMALIAGRLYKDSYRPPRDARPERADVEAVFENILLERKARDLSLQAAHSFFLRARYLRGRASFVTHDDRVGLGPRFMQAGDILTVLLGLYLAVVLRPTSSSSSEYEVIGEAYCDGFMEGEALLSPLPGAWDIVRRDHASGPSFVAFIDRDDGTVQPEDPRLAGLPKGWTRKPHADEQTYTWFVDEDSEEQFWGGGDPRLRAEVLKERGVPLQNFRLV